MWYDASLYSTCVHNKQWMQNWGKTTARYLLFLPTSAYHTDVLPVEFKQRSWLDFLECVTADILLCFSYQSKAKDWRAFERSLNRFWRNIIWFTKSKMSSRYLRDKYPKIDLTIVPSWQPSPPKNMQSQFELCFSPHKASPRMQINRYLQLLLLLASSPLLSPVERGSKNVLAGMWPSSSSF